MPTKQDASRDERGWTSLEYISGFHNHVETEAVPATLPVGQNSPQVVAHGLFAEQLSGSAFTCPRISNRKSWLYRLTPSVKQGGYEPADATSTCPMLGSDFCVVDPNPRRWSPLPLTGAGRKVDWADGLRTICGAGAPALKEGVAIHMYACNAPMLDRAFCNADGELLIVPQLGVLRAMELGRLRVAPGEILVVPRNIRFSISPEEGADADAAAAGCRGYVLELFAGRGFVLPELGPIGANGLAEPRDFLQPVAWFEDRECPGGFRITTKYCGRVFDTTRTHSPYDVVAWHGNYAPYKYDLSRFHAVNTVAVDHPDLHLHRPHLPVVGARRGGRGLCDLPTAVDVRRAHLPSAVLPPTSCPSSWASSAAATTPRPTGRTVSAGRRLAARRLDAARPRRAGLRGGRRRRHECPQKVRRRPGLYVRDVRAAAAHAACDLNERRAAQLPGLLAGAAAGEDRGGSQRQRERA